MLYNTILNHERCKKQNGEFEEKNGKPVYENADSRLSNDLLCDKMQKDHSGKKSSRVLIASCYYSKEQIQKLFNSLKGRDVKLILSTMGHSSDKIEEIIKDLRKIKKTGKKKIYVCNSFPLMHSKIYYSEICQSRSANCLVGSSNLSSGGLGINEEILVEIKDPETKKQIKQYLKDLIKKSFNIDSKKGFAKRTITRDNFITFISKGFIVFQPNDQIQLNYSGNDLRKISGRLKGYVVNGSFNAELSIDLKSFIITKLNRPIETKIKSGARIKQHCVETCLGYWLPSGRHYKSLMEKKNNQEQIEKRIDDIIDALNSIKLDDELKTYVDDFFSSIKNYDGSQVIVTESEKKSILNDIVKFVKRKISYLTSRKVTIARGFLMTPMPYFWDDAASAQEFYLSFWDWVDDFPNKTLAKEIRNYFENTENKNWQTLKAKENVPWLEC